MIRTSTSLPRMHIRTALLILVLLFAVATSTFAAAQNVAAAETTGTITGTLNGEEFAWRTVLFETPEGDQNTASFNRMAMGPITLFDFSLQGHFADQFTEQAIVLGFAIFNEDDLLHCPCTFDDAEAMYFTTSSMFGNVYVADGTLTVETAEKLDDDTYALSGTFVGEGIFMESPTNIDNDNVMEFHIDFSIDRVSAFDIEL